jgi:hypothetical protein
VGCNSLKSAHLIYFSLSKGLEGGDLVLKQKNLPKGGFNFVLLISPHGSLAGWHWHLADQVAGRSKGQVPHATLHDFTIYGLAGILGVLVGLVIAAVVSSTIGTTSSFFIGKVSDSAVNVFYGLGRREIGPREQLAGDLNAVRHHKLFNRFDEALIKIENVLARDPDYPEALFLKARILWEGFEDCDEAKSCLLKIIKVEPDKESPFHRWALDFYRELSKS